MTDRMTLRRFLAMLAERPAGPSASPIWEGIDPTDPEVRRFLDGSVDAGFDPRSSGLTLAIAERISYLEESSMARLRMRVARRVGIPYSEVVECWTADDLAMEAAHDVLQAMDQVERCDTCGVAEWEVWDPETRRWLENGKWKITEHACKWCRELTVANEGVSKQDREDGIRYVTRHRQPGDERLELDANPQIG